jgi:hypothetical protein
MSKLKPGGPERRAGGRRRVEFHSRVILVREGFLEVEGTITNLSAGGCYVVSKAEVGRDDLIKLRFESPEHGDLTVWGHVAFRVDGFGFGVNFTAFAHGSRGVLAAILDGEPGRT